MAGAAPRAEPGSPPGGAQRSRVLDDEVGKVLSRCLAAVGARHEVSPASVGLKTVTSTGLPPRQSAVRVERWQTDWAPEPRTFLAFDEPGMLSSPTLHGQPAPSSA